MGGGDVHELRCAGDIPGRPDARVVGAQLPIDDDLAARTDLHPDIIDVQSGGNWAAAGGHQQPLRRRWGWYRDVGLLHGGILRSPWLITAGLILAALAIAAIVLRRTGRAAVGDDCCPPLVIETDLTATTEASKL